MFAIGLAAIYLKDEPNKFDGYDSMCVAGWGNVFSEGESEPVKFQPKNGDKILVRINKKQVEWLLNGRQFCTILLRSEIENKPLYPVCWIRSFTNVEGISRLQFIGSEL